MLFWQVPKMWEGGECWIIGGGSSIPRQFGVPADTIAKVENREQTIAAYSNYLTPLHGKHVIGVNIAFLLGPWISAMFFADAQVFRAYKTKGLFDFHNLKVTCATNKIEQPVSICRNIKRVKRDYNYGLSDKPDMVCYNYSSGGAAIDLAAHFGVKRILLLGFDMKANGNGKTHWHAGYQFYHNPTDKEVFRRFVRAFPRIAEHAKKRRIEILNVNPDSALDTFPKVALNEVL